jgi:hypothetical protein
MFFSGFNPADAEDSMPDKFSITIGGYSVYRYDETTSYSDQDLGTGISISPRDALGLNNEKTVLRLTGHYRFTQEHALTWSWYRISSKGNKTIEEEFGWVDENNDPITVPVGAKTRSDIDYDIIKAGYLWSFYHSDKVEMAAGAGLHITSIDIDLDADTTSSDVDAQKASVSVPLPVVSFSVTYSITPEFQWKIKGEALTMKFDDWEGIYSDITLSMEYRAHNNIGLGIGLGTSALNLKENKRHNKFIYDNRISGVLFYAAAYY